MLFLITLLVLLILGMSIILILGWYIVENDKALQETKKKRKRGKK